MRCKVVVWEMGFAPSLEKPRELFPLPSPLGGHNNDWEDYDPETNSHKNPSLCYSDFKLQASVDMNVNFQFFWSLLNCETVYSSLSYGSSHFTFPTILHPPPISSKVLLRPLLASSYPVMKLHCLKASACLSMKSFLFSQVQLLSPIALCPCLTISFSFCNYFCRAIATGMV